MKSIFSIKREIKVIVTAIVICLLFLPSMSGSINNQNEQQYNIYQQDINDTNMYQCFTDGFSDLNLFPWWNRWPDFPGRYEPFFEVHDIVDFGQTACGLTSADFNKDDELDFAVCWATSPWTQTTISVCYNNGDGSFTRDDVYTNDQPYLRYFEDVASGDYDNDGDIDLLFTYDNKTTSKGTVNLLFNDGKNNFSNATIVTVLVPTGPSGRDNPQICSADFDEDGDLDFLVGDNSGLVGFYLNNGLGNFYQAAVYDFGGAMSWGLSSADFDNDGDIDFIVTQEKALQEGYVYLVLNDGSDSCFNQSDFVKIADIPPRPSFFAGIMHGFGCLCSIDYDDDGLMDFVFAGGDSIFLYMQQETGFFEYFHLMSLPGRNAEDGWYLDDLRSGGIAVGDYNQDGLTDLIIGGVQGVARICYNNLVLVDIIRPDGANLFISNDLIWQYGLLNPIMIYSFIKYGTSVVVGDLTVKAKGLVPLQKVEFYLGMKLVYTDDTAPYEWNWTSLSFGRHKIKAVAYDTNGEKLGYDDAIVWKFF